MKHRVKQLSFSMKNSNPLIFIFVATVAVITSLLFIWFQMKQAEQSGRENSSLILLEEQVAREPKNLNAGIMLSHAYLQNIRETGDMTRYVAIEQILDTLESAHPEDSEINAMRAEIANGRHDFRKALAYITKAVNQNPQHASYQGIKSDSELELGMYDEALATLQVMVDLKPNFSSFSRVAYQRELHGDREGALMALESAISAGSSYPENIAWAYVESGKLRLLSDRSAATQDFSHALELTPEYAPALEGLGRVASIEGEKEKELEYYLRAFKKLPIAPYAIALGNFYDVEGDAEKTSQYYALADLTFREAKDTNVDLEYSLFLADHGDITKALLLAESAYRNRPSIFAADAYGWALFKNNRHQEAEIYSTESLRLGGHDAVLLNHAGHIKEALGKHSEAQELFRRAKQ
jgi:tetratricopeptide (TPR) repeat protein